MRNPWWKRVVGGLLVFSLDFFLVYASTFFLLVYTSASRIFPSLGLPGWFWLIPSFLLSLVVLGLYKVVHALLGRDENKAGMQRALERIFFGLLSLSAAVSCFLVLRATFVIQDLPWSVVLLFALIVLIALRLLPKSLRMRKPGLFLAAFVFFGLYMMALVRTYISEADFIPPEHPGVRVIREIANPLATPPSDPMKRAWDLNMWWCRNFLGLEAANYQFSYLCLSEDEEFIYVSDYNMRGTLGWIYKVRLSDLSVLAQSENLGPTCDMFEEQASNALIVPHFVARKVCVFNASTLEKQICTGVGSTAVGHVVRLPNQNLVATSETGRLFVITPAGEIVQSTALPIQLEEKALDKSGRFLVIGAISGCTVTVMDMETMKVVRKRCLPFGTIDTKIDLEGDRIFLPLTFIGNLEVLDLHTLETLAHVPLDPGLRAACYIPDYDMIAVSNHFSGDLYFVDGTSYRVVKTLWAGTRTRDMKYAPARKKLYVGTALRVLEIDMRVLFPEHPQSAPSVSRSFVPQRNSPEAGDRERPKG